LLHGKLSVSNKVFAASALVFEIVADALMIVIKDARYRSIDSSTLCYMVV
jgi:hypothetical protein